MATDLFGKPLGARSEFKLNLQQKRQATLLYHWMSLEYRQRLKTMIDALIQGADVTLDTAQSQGRDAVIANPRWGVRDTSANWSTHVYPALEDFKKSTIWHIAAVASEEYGQTGANQCAHMIGEYSSLWMTPEEEEAFMDQFAAVALYAAYIDDAAGSGGERPGLEDNTMVEKWLKHSHLFPRLPKFRVRTDVEGVSDKKPPRTGVYVAQDDVSATLQFAWTGNTDGILGDAMTFNRIGQRLLTEIGRDALWIDDTKMSAIAIDEITRDPNLYTGMASLESVKQDPADGAYVMSITAFTSRPCKWYFVEMIEGEYESEEEAAATAPQQPPASTNSQRCEAGQPCPRSGYWFTPARANSRRHFKQGETMHDAGGDYGSTIWQWDPRQD